jgi:hypothetical protein
MAPLPQEEIATRRGRRVWLWVLTGMLLVCLLSCAGIVGWIGFTDSGQNYWSTVEAQATEEADN